jgi:DNA sulfur modification protein DndB
MSKTKWDKIVSGNNLDRVKIGRSKDFITLRERSIALPDFEEEGWVKYRSYKDPKFIGIKKNKKFDELFEDKIWLILYNMGFTHMNLDRNFEMSYDPQNEAITQQIDVFAADDETVLVIECKASETLRDGIFKKQIEAFRSQMEGLRKEISQRFPGRKIKFIWATQNYIMSKPDLEKLKAWGIALFNDSEIEYYSELVKHLGAAAKYQLLGNIFANQRIQNMDNKIPAIRGKMGSHTYYSFSIEPEKLLKIGYVLHRSDANSDMMPTYQRIIKKSRLKSVKKFIDEDKGYFPNSIIISIDTKRPLVFDKSDKQVDNAIATLGILYLPQRYKSAYIIDGQHRLYGYSDSQYAKTNSIPVVAFENLAKEEQIKLFMEINENQKSVSKNLRNTLNADMQWNSPKFNERRDALRLRIAQKLGEDYDSPLYGRIIIGEDQSTSLKCITIESIRSAINVGNFLSKFDNKNKIEKTGTFDLNENEETFELLYFYIEACFRYIKNNLELEWQKGSNDNGILTINNGIGGIIRVINSISDHFIKHGVINPFKDKPEYMAKQAEYYLDSVIRFYENISEEQRDIIRKTYGGNGPVYSCRCLERSINEEHSIFNPEGLQKYWEDHSKEYNAESLNMIVDIERSIKGIIRHELENKGDGKWISEIPKSVYTQVNKDLLNHQYETGEISNFWDFISMNDCREIIQYGRNWSELFEQRFTLPSQIKKVGGKSAKTEWLFMVDRLQRNVGKSAFSVKKDEYELLCEIYKEFVPEDVTSY